MTRQVVLLIYQMEEMERCLLRSLIVNYLHNERDDLDTLY